MYFIAFCTSKYPNLFLIAYSRYLVMNRINETYSGMIKATIYITLHVQKYITSVHRKCHCFYDKSTIKVYDEDCQFVSILERMRQNNFLLNSFCIFFYIVLDSYQYVKKLISVLDILCVVPVCIIICTPMFYLRKNFKEICESGEFLFYM